MKMLVAIVNITEAGNVNKALNEAGIKAEEKVEQLIKEREEELKIMLGDRYV